MRHFLRYLLAAAVAVGASVSARAEADENGIEPKHWYKFNGNLDSSGATALTISGEKGDSYVDSGKGVQAYQFKSGYHPYGSGIKRGNSDFTVVTVAKTANLDHGIIWSQGTVSTARGFALVTVGEDKVALRVFGSSWSSSGADLFTATVSSAASEYHVYTLIYQNSGYKFSLYVDAATEPVGTGSVADSATESGFPNNSYQWGSLNGGTGYSMMQGYGCCLDDFRLYQQALTTDQIKNIVASFRGDAVWGNAGSATEAGVATTSNGGEYSTFNVNFGATDNISQTGIEGYGTVCISKVRLFRRSKYTADPPATITISQEGAASVESVSVALTAGQQVYGANWPASSGDHYSADAFDAVFDSKQTFDTSKPITLTFPKSQLFMLQPANSVMSSSGWSPAIEITGTYVENTEPRSFEATLEGRKLWSELEWSPELPKNLNGRDTMTVNVEGSDSVLLMDSAFSTSAAIEFTDAVTIGADDNLYENGCWQKDILRAGRGLTFADGVTFPEVKDGFVGAYGKNDNAITLRAQNKEVISINFAKGYSQTGTAYAGLAPVQGNTWMNLTDTWSNAETDKDLPALLATEDGVTTRARGGITGTWGCYTFWQYTTGVTENFLKGYLDDGGNHARFTLDNIPYSSYDVIIYCATDTGGRKFDSITVNGAKYTCGADGVAKAGDAAWGATQTTSAQFGVNAMIVKGLNHASLSVLGGSNDGSTTRGGIAAVQIVCTGTIESVRDFTATISGSTDFESIDWNEGSFEEGVLTTATITNDTSSAAEVSITFKNPRVTMAKLKVVSSRDVRLVASEALANVAVIDMSECTGKVTYALPVTALASSENKVVYTGGTAAGMRIGIVHQGGALNLEGGTYNLSETHGDVETTVNVTDSALNYDAAITMGRGAYVVGGNSTVNAVSFVLVQGKGNDSAFTLKDSATVAVTGTTVDDSNKNSVMFGHWDGASVFTLQDTAAFTAEGTQVLVGKTGNNHEINLNGGTFTAKGIKASTAATGTNVLNLDGASLFLGEFGISSYGSTTIAVNVKSDSTITSTAKMPITQPVTIDAGAVLTLDATAGEIALSGKLANAGTIRVTGGTLYLVDTDAPGAYETEGTGQVLFGYTVTINDCNRFKVPGTVDINLVKLYDTAGNEVTITSRNPETRVITFEMERYGKACLMEYLFPGNLASTGRDTGTMQFDGTHCFPGDEYVAGGGIKAASAPWRNVSFPSEVTVVMYGKVMKTDNSCQIGIGSTTGGSKYTLFLASGDVSKDEVVLGYAYKNIRATGAGVEEHGVLCTMSVPNAQTADHLYAFTMQQVGGKTEVNIYLDGEVLQPYTFGTAVTLGSGIQLGSIHGGVGNTQDWPDAFGFKRSTEVETDATLAFLRVYDMKLGDEVMRQMAIDYPYVSPNGSYQRSVPADELWDKANAWTQEGAGVTTNVPAEKATVKIEAGDSSQLAVNLGADALYESIQIAGDGPFSIVRQSGYSGKVRSSGRVTVRTDTTFAYDAVDLVGTPLKVEDGCTVTFDMSSVDLGSVWSEATYELTGLVTTGAEARVVCSYDEVPPGRTISYGIDPTDQHFKFHVTMAGGLVAELSDDSTFGDLVWKIEDTVVHPDWTRQVYGTINVMKANAKLTFSSSLASASSVLAFEGGKPVTLAATAGAEVTGVIYDFTKLGEKGTFLFDPGTTAVRAGYVRYDLELAARDYNNVLVSPGGRYEFKKIRINGHDYDYHDRTVIVQEGDYLDLNDGSELGCGLSLDVRGGEVHLGRLDGYAYVAYGRNGTKFNQSGGTVTVHATGTAQTGNNGFVLAHSSTGGGCHEFNVTGGLFTVPDSSICFNEATNTINVGKSGVVRAKGAFSKTATSSGVMNVTAGGAFEVGSLGVTAGAMKSFVLDGGTLRGYEDGAAFSGSIAFEGEAKVASSAGATLTLGGATGTGSGRVTVSEGTVRLGNGVALGLCDVSVANGATLDYNGQASANVISIAGSGVGGAGAVVNRNATATGDFNLVLAADATIGGSNPISFSGGSSVNLAGRTLTVNGSGAFVFALGSFAVTGTGAIAVESGKLATGGETQLPDADLSIGVDGVLDLAAGTSVSCRNFSSRGTVSGEVAALVVTGTFDASSSTEVTNLRLAGGATLRGQGLVVTKALTLGSVLNVTVDKLASNVKIATVPADPIVVVGTTVIVNGTGGYTLSQVGTTLLATKGGGVFADVVIDSAIGWTNFEELRVEGMVKDFHGAASGKTNINVVVSSGDGTVTTQRFDYVVGEGGCFTNYVAGLEQGKTYDVSVFITIEGFDVEAESAVSRAAMARTVEGWIAEDARTFAGEKPGTGYWSGTNGIASVASGKIRFVSEDWTRAAVFEPTNSTPEVKASQIREIRFKAQFDCPGYYTFEEDVPSAGDGIATVTLVADEDEVCSFAVAETNVWRIVPRATFAPELGYEYEIAVLMDYTASNLVYSVVSNNVTVRLATCVLAASPGDMRIDISGSGSIDSIVGTCYDANLMQVGSSEYWDFDAARKAAGSTRDIVPLWLTHYELKDNAGAFRIFDNGLFDLSFAKWYHCLVERDDDVLCYRYRAANNWIEYADESGVVPGDGGWLVTSEAGLAWLAERATNEWISGNVTLGADLDLASKNWTPIAQFTGVFDGQGHTVVGLNNTNVVDDPLLGEAGHYFCGPTNDWNYTAYGLFASATNAAFRNLTLADVAISNAADSAAALLGVHAGGSLEVVCVTNESGFVRGEGRAVAGLLTVGGAGAEIGDVVVTGNVSRVTVGGALANSADGGNVAQILAGTTADTVFAGDVAATNNVAEGDFDVYVTDGPVTKPWAESSFAWLGLPACNFAHAVIRTDEYLDFWRFVEANDVGEIPVDPVSRTARMLAGNFANGEDNIAGWWMDTISAISDGGTVTLHGTNNTLDVWNTVYVDRSITFDLNTNCVYGVYDCDVFNVADGKTLTLKNGVIYYAEGFSPAVGSVVLSNVKSAVLSGDFYERTVPLSDLEVTDDYVTIEIPYTSSDFRYVVDSTPTLAEDWTEDVASEMGTGGKLAIRVPAVGDACFYRVRIVGDFLP